MSRVNNPPRHYTRRIPEGSLPDPLRSNGLPNLLGYFLLGAGALLALRRIVELVRSRDRAAVHEGKPDELRYPVVPLRPVIVAVTVFLFFHQLERVGYLLGAAVTMAVGLFLMEKRGRAMLVVFPIAFAVLTWVIFSLALRIPLQPFPAGF